MENGDSFPDEITKDGVTVWKQSGSASDTWPELRNLLE
jgi:hypothetical protein